MRVRWHTQLHLVKGRSVRHPTSPARRNDGLHAIARHMIPLKMQARQGGFTLIELLIVLLLAALLLGIGIPSFSDFIRNSRLSSAANGLLADLNVARSEAVKRRRPVTLCATSTPEAATPDCDGGRGWVIFEDDNGDASFNALTDQRIAARDPLTTLVTVKSRTDVSSSTPSLAYVTYAPTGFRRMSNAAELPTDSRVLLCDPRGNKTVGRNVDDSALSAARLVQISITGRALVTRSVSQIDSEMGGC
jgi:type IV fimbrial biogenesis protein FimT